MAEIVLTTLNAKYIHSAFGLRYLLANMGELRNRTELLEFDINQRPLEIVEKLLAPNPKIIGFGVYIWNTRESLEVIELIRQLVPEITLIVGGPEVSFEFETQAIVAAVDYVITGEADLKFAEVCAELLAGKQLPGKVVAAELPALDKIAMPYVLYSDDDLAHRVIYVEASRGCPFTCEFCLSSLDIPVRQFPLERFLDAMADLLKRGATQFKFVDRTFNLNLIVSGAILSFFQERYFPGLFLHFEMIPDRLPPQLREQIRAFPSGALQFEVGIQTFDEATSANISRRQNHDRLAENFQFLREETGVHVHADLIVGLPGETLESFGAGFDRLIALGPQEIQVGILKRLKGTPIMRHDAEWGMVYSPHPPFEILRNKLLDFETLQRLRRFARYWDLVGNSGNFRETTPLIWGEGSPFAGFLSFSNWLYERSNRRHGIALTQLAGFVFDYLLVRPGVNPVAVAERLLRDYQRAGRSDVPLFLREYIVERVNEPVPTVKKNAPKRQSLHLTRSTSDNL